MSEDYEKFVRDCLRPFPPSQIDQLPKKGVKLDYVSHAYVTQRLLELDPFWTWEFLAQDTNGLPLFDEYGGLWIRLTVKGVSRYGYGEPVGGITPADKIKSAVGDAIRNAAMRFGIALALWQKDKTEANAPVYREVPAVMRLKAKLASYGAQTAAEAVHLLFEKTGQAFVNFEDIGELDATHLLELLND